MNPTLRIFLITFCFTSAAFANSKPVGGDWVASWATSQQIPEPHNALSPDDLRDATLRQIVHLSVGGKTLRVHITNAFGTTPLSLTSVHIAHPWGQLRLLDRGNRRVEQVAHEIRKEQPEAHAQKRRRHRRDEPPAPRNDVAKEPRKLAQRRARLVRLYAG